MPPARRRMQARTRSRCDLHSDAANGTGADRHLEAPKLFAICSGRQDSEPSRPPTKLFFGARRRAWPSLALRVVVRARQRKPRLSAVTLVAFGAIFRTGAAHIMLLRTIAFVHGSSQCAPGALPNPGRGGKHAHAHFGARTPRCRNRRKTMPSPAG